MAISGSAALRVYPWLLAWAHGAMAQTSSCRANACHVFSWLSQVRLRQPSEAIA